MTNDLPPNGEVSRRVPFTFLRKHRWIWAATVVGIAIIAAAIVFGRDLLFLFQQSSTPEPAYQSFYFKDGSVWFSYPPDWHTDADQDSKTLVSFYSLPLDTLAAQGPSFDVCLISIKNSELSPDTEYSSSPAAFLKHMEEFSGEFQDIRQLTVDGYPAASGIGSMSDTVNYLYLVILRENDASRDLIIFAFFSPDSQWDQYQPVVQNIMNTIEVLPLH